MKLPKNRIIRYALALALVTMGFTQSSYGMNPCTSEDAFDKEELEKQHVRAVESEKITPEWFEQEKKNEKNKDIEHVYMGVCEIENNSKMSALFEETFPNAISVKIRYAPVSAMSEMIKDNTKIKSVSLSLDITQDELDKILYPALRSMRNLESVDINSSKKLTKGILPDSVTKHELNFNENTRMQIIQFIDGEEVNKQDMLPGIPVKFL